MKKLICAKDVEHLIEEGKKEIIVEAGVIITPSAKDMAASNRMEFVTKDTKVIEEKEKSISADMIYQVLKTLSEQGMLKGIFDTISTPYEVEKDESGLKLIRGESVKYDYFDTGDSGVKAYFQELVSKEDSKMSAGFLMIEESSFDWELTYEEIDYVIEGTLCITINGKKYTAHKGDVLFVPAGSKVVWESPDKAKIFYATYPANWADLIA